MEPQIQVRCHYPSGTIVLNRPEKRNALSRALIRDLKEAFFDLHQERRVRAVILTGAGPAFCAGMDLAEMRETAKRDDAQQQWHEDAETYRDLLETMLRFPKPIIAAVPGPAMAGGMGLVLAADIVLAAKEAAFGLPEPKRGLVAGMVAPLFVFRVGAGRAARWLLTGERFDLDEAQQMGLVHEQTEQDLLWARAHELAQACAESAPEAIQLTKQVLNETIGHHLWTALAAGAAVSATARTTEAAQEGLAAFLEKRPPKW